MDYWNKYWSYGIVYKSDGGLLWTAGTSTGVVELSIKVLEDLFVLREHQLALWNRL